MCCNNRVSKSARVEHCVLFQAAEQTTQESVFNDCETIVCGVLLWCCQVCPQQYWILKFGDLGAFSGLKSWTQWRLSKVPTAAWRCSPTLQTASECESLRLCTPLVSGVAGRSLGLFFMFSIFFTTFIFQFDKVHLEQIDRWTLTKLCLLL